MTTIVLVADDEDPIRELVAAALEEEGYRVMRAHNGAGALTLALAVRPNLVITDLMMPSIDGAELCRQLKADARMRGVPVVIMSAAERANAIPADADGFLAKPFELDALLALVGRYAGPPSTAAGD
jgi:DNA-binding response OmpR family regulator